MKVKTSITLSEDVLKALDKLFTEYQSRSEVIEVAVQFFINKKLAELREAKDLALINKNSTRLNQEAEDVLSYQVEV